MESQSSSELRALWKWPDENDPDEDCRRLESNRGRSLLGSFILLTAMLHYDLLKNPSKKLNMFFLIR